MENQRPEESIKPATFGRRKAVPRVCVIDGKQHIRKFVGEALEEIGFITSECTQVSELSTVVDAELPHLFVVGFSAAGIEPDAMLKALAARAFDGHVLLFGPRDSPALAALQELGEQLGIAMLPTLPTPFRTQGLYNSVATLLPPKRQSSNRTVTASPAIIIPRQATNSASTRIDRVTDEANQPVASAQ